jgi:hypothetical protein
MRGNVEQAWANRVKALRAAVRLKYSIMADNELNRRIDEEYKRFYKAVQSGKLLPPVDPKKIVDSETTPNP